MLPEYFAVVGAIIASMGGLYYFYETLTGKSQPNRVTWFLWGVLPMIVFVAQKTQGVEGVSWASFVAGFTPFLVLAASFLNKKAYWETKPLDYVCLLVAVVGIVLWMITDNANLAILFTIFADAAALFPTLLKSIKHPETESWIAYAISAFGFTISILTIDVWVFQSYAFLAYLILGNFLLAVFSSRKPSKDPLRTEPA